MATEPGHPGIARPVAEPGVLAAIDKIIGDDGRCAQCGQRVPRHSPSEFFCRELCQNVWASRNNGATTPPHAADPLSYYELARRFIDDSVRAATAEQVRRRQHLIFMMEEAIIRMPARLAFVEEVQHRPEGVLVTMRFVDEFGNTRRLYGIDPGSGGSGTVDLSVEEVAPSAPPAQGVVVSAREWGRTRLAEAWQLIVGWVSRVRRRPPPSRLDDEFREHVLPAGHATNRTPAQQRLVDHMRERAEAIGRLARALDIPPDLLGGHPSPPPGRGYHTPRDVACAIDYPAANIRERCRLQVPPPEPFITPISPEVTD